MHKPLPRPIISIFFPASVWIFAKCSDISIFDSLITCSPYFAKVDRKKKLYWLQLDFLMLDYNVISFEYYDIYKKNLAFDSC